MKSSVAWLVLATAALSTAAPVSINEDSAVEIFARANPTAVKCPQNTWTSNEVGQAFDGLKTNMNKTNKQKPSFGTKYWPKNFKTEPQAIVDALDAIAECKTGQANKSYLEFPIASSTYTGGDPGADRVVAIVSSKDGMKPFTDPVYCISVGHPTKTDNSFEVCPVN